MRAENNTFGGSQKGSPRDPKGYITIVLYGGGGGGGGSVLGANLSLVSLGYALNGKPCQGTG